MAKPVVAVKSRRLDLHRRSKPLDSAAPRAQIAIGTNRSD
jgi:hypothetical protein